MSNVGLLRRRGVAQLPLLSAVVAMVTIGATLLGVCALLLTVSQDQALDQGLAQADPDDVSATAYVTDVGGKDSAAVVADTRAAMATALAPFAIRTDIQASSVPRPLADRGGETFQLTYLSAIDGLADRTRLIAGRRLHPSRADTTGPVEATVLESTARRLGLSIGDRVRLGPENTATDPGAALTVEVVGIVQPVTDAGWDRDPLGGAGYNPSFVTAQYLHEAVAYGPFIVDPADLWASRATLDRLQVSARPDLSHPTGPALAAATVSLGEADVRLKAKLDDRVGNERVVSALAVTLAQARFQQDVTRSTVLVVVLLGTALTAAALGLAGRLMVSLRATETALFSAMGADRRQLAAQAAVEALTLAAVSTVLAVPSSSLAHFGLTHLPHLVDAGMAAPLGVTGTQVITVLTGALLLAAILVVPALRPDPARLSGSGRPLELLTRSGADLLLLLLAGVGWWQLHSQPAAAGGTDAVRVAAPVLCLLAGAALAPRLVAVPLRIGDRLARTSRGLVLPLAVFEAARRPRAVAAGLLLALAAAAGTFGLAFGSTWEHSQRDQAALRVGTDLAVSLTSPVRAGQAAPLADATGGTVSPVTDRDVTLGNWMGDSDDFPRLLAVDTRQAGALLRGRLPDGKTWAQEGPLTAPATPAIGAALAAGSAAPITVTGTVAGITDLQATPRLVLQDRQGVRTPCDLPVVPLDGRPHVVPLCDAPPTGSQIIALELNVQTGPGLSVEQVKAMTQLGKRATTLELRLPAAPETSDGEQKWVFSPMAVASMPDSGDSTTLTTTAGTTVLRSETRLQLRPRSASDSQPAPLGMVISPFPDPFVIPAVVSQRLLDELQVEVGGQLAVTVGVTELPVQVTDVVPTIPSAVGAVALLVDSDLLSRALIMRGDFDPPVDAFWVGDLTRPDAAARATALNLGPVDTRAGLTKKLSRGPLRIGLPAALFVLVPAVILLVLAGTVMNVTTDVDARAVEIARLRGLGLSRRRILGGLLAQHGGLLALLLGCGAAVGVVTSFAVAPLLVRSDLGAAPVPTVLASWPWTSETAVLATLLIGSIAAVAVVVRIQLRRADASYLRAGG